MSDNDDRLPGLIGPPTWEGFRAWLDSLYPTPVAKADPVEPVPEKPKRGRRKAKPREQGPPTAVERKRKRVKEAV
jgi:hypothetical protein